MIHQVLFHDENGQCLATREMYMMLHPGLNDPDLKEGDVIELVEGFFVLNDDLNPMQLATDEQIRQARERR